MIRLSPLVSGRGSTKVTVSFFSLWVCKESRQFRPALVPLSYQNYAFTFSPFFSLRTRVSGRYALYLKNDRDPLCLKNLIRIKLLRNLNSRYFELHSPMSHQRRRGKHSRSSIILSEFNHTSAYLICSEAQASVSVCKKIDGRWCVSVCKKIDGRWSWTTK